MFDPKWQYLGGPSYFRLEMACQAVTDAFGGPGEYGCFLVGSCLEITDWRDVDVRLILSDEVFARLFPLAGDHWEHDPRWLLLTTAISAHLSRVTDLPVDFQFQQMTHANKRFSGKRFALGMRIAPAAVVVTTGASQ